MFARRKLAARPHGQLFTSLESGWLDPSDTGNRMREALDEISFDWVTSHVWRKAVATCAVTECHYIKRRSRNKKAAATLESIKPTKKPGRLADCGRTPQAC